MAFADVARLVWSPAIAPARETSSNDQVEDASIMRDRRETLAAPEGPVSDSSSNLPQETRGKARESKLNLNREVIAEAANEARSDASLPGREAMTGPMTGPMNAETIGYLTSGLVREVTSDLISGETLSTPPRQAEHSIARERPAMAETAASRNLGRLTCPVSEASAELARDCTWAGPALAHDAKNLLSALRLYGELLGFAGVLNAKHRHYADDLKLLAGRSQKLIERLLERSQERGQERGQEFGKERGQGRGETQAATAVSVASAAYDEVSAVGEAAGLEVARSGEDELRTEEVDLHQLAEPAPQRAEARVNGMLQTNIGRGNPAVRAGISGADRVREPDAPQLRGDGRGINSSMQMREARESLRRISSFESNMERASSDPGGNISPAMAGEFNDRNGERGRAPAREAAIISPAKTQVTAVADVPALAQAVPVNLVDLLLRWGSLLSTLAQGALEVRFGPRAATPIAVEAEAIERILVNLVRNAAAATRRGGAIRIAVGAQAKEAPDPRQQSERHEVMVLTVDDSGDGMTAQQVDRALGRHDHPAPNESAKQRHAVIGPPRQELAEPFVSGYGSWPGCRLEGPTRETEPADAAAAALREFLDEIDEEERAASSLQWGWSGVPRHGLGLTIVRGLVRSSGGILSIHSRPGLGTRIEISWPMVDVKRAPAALKKTSTGEGGGIWQPDAEAVEVPRRSSWPPDGMREEEIRTLDKPVWNAALGRRGSEIGVGGTQVGVGREGAIAC
jgi:signal transduction histidine kinase